jgi:hypothetical protein
VIKNLERAKSTKINEMEARTGCDAFVGLHIDSLFTPNQRLTHLEFILKGPQVSTVLSTKNVRASFNAREGKIPPPSLGEEICFF